MGEVAENIDPAMGDINWTFQGGNPATSTEVNPTVVFQNEGTYEFTLEVKDAGGNILATQTSFVVVKSPPVADFNFTLSGPILVLENTSSPNSDTYSWVFGDGSTSTEMNPTYVYNSNGNYTVTLIANNDCGASTHTVNVNVNTSSNFMLPYNAQSTLTPYDGPFRPGTNFGYNPPWTDISLADIAAGNPLLNIKGVGVKAARPALPGSFVDEFGYEFNIPNYEHYDNLTVLQLDAHTDLRPEYEGTPYNHACAVFDASQNTNLIQVGIRSMDKSEKHIRPLDN